MSYRFSSSFADPRFNPSSPDARSFFAIPLPRYQELVEAWQTELVKAEREGKDFNWEDAVRGGRITPVETRFFAETFGAEDAGSNEEKFR